MVTDIVKEIMRAFTATDLNKLKFKCDEFEIEVERDRHQQITYTATEAETQTIPTTIPTFNAPKREEAPKGREVKSPMVGTFYARSSPRAQPFVSVGSKVKKGDVICIIEAMKLMNEIEADCDGEISAILVENGEMVEFDQPMFVIK